jgi:hypothetical protein
MFLESIANKFKACIVLKQYPRLPFLMLPKP